MIIASLLEGAWRKDPEPIATSSKAIAAVAPLLQATGSAALVWRRLQRSAVSGRRSFRVLKDAYRQHAIEALIHETNVRDIFKRARGAGVEPVLFKGWAIARLYRDDALRPYGDIDLWLSPEDLDQLYTAAWSNRDGATYAVEPHTRFYPQYQRSFAEVFERSHLIQNADVAIRVPCAEDHLRFVCLHFLFHGGWRPLWLCDVALMVETQAANFDWDRCLTGKRKHADWIACTIGLARELLGAEVGGTPFAKRAGRLPGWLKPAVLRQWAQGSGMSTAESLSFTLPRRLREPGAFIEALRRHWRNPIQASVEMGAWFDDSPRYQLQIASALRQMPRFAHGIGKGLRHAWHSHSPIGT